MARAQKEKEVKEVYTRKKRKNSSEGLKKSKETARVEYSVDITLAHTHWQGPNSRS